MQPHYPFLTDKIEIDKGHLNDPNVEGQNIWNQIMEGTIDMAVDKLWELYISNLIQILPAVKRLMTSLEGRTVVTSDHGNMVGERAFPVPIREWGHPRGIYTEPLVKVPWLIYENGPRREIIAEPSQDSHDETDDEIVTERLRNLGYTG